MKRFLFLITCTILIQFEMDAMQFEDVMDLSEISASPYATGEKPQSKVWNHDGKNWAVISSNAGTRLFRLDGSNWTSILMLSSETAKADCKVMGNKVYVLLVDENAQLITLEYIQNSYSMMSTQEIFLDDDVETATVDVDGANRMWIAFDGDDDEDDHRDTDYDGNKTHNIYIRWSDAPYNNWSQRHLIRSNVDNDDDIGAVIALPGKIGVLWSDQNSERFGFKTHQDGDSPTLWSDDELPVSSANGDNFADDHLNMAVATDGTLYCVVKTGYDSRNDPVIALMVRQPSGDWDELYEVSNDGTRPIVLLNEGTEKIRVIYTSRNGGGDILYRESNTNHISFGPEHELISGNYDNPTSIKDNFNSEVVILASDDSEVVGVLASDNYEPPLLAAPELLYPEDAANEVPTQLDFDWSASDGADTYQIQISKGADFNIVEYERSDLVATTASFSGLENGIEYFWRVRAVKDGNDGDWSQSFRFTTISAIAEVPVQELPEDNASGISVNPVLSWKSANGADTYDVQVSADSSFSNLLRNETGLTVTSLQLNDLSEGTQYFWRVRSVNEVGKSEWTPVWSFMTTSAIVGVPILNLPENGTFDISIDPTLNWNSVEGADTYHVQVSAESGFSTMIVDEIGLLATSFQVQGLLNDTRYFWRVRSVRGDVASEWSQIWEFSTIPTIAAIPSLKAPLDAAIDIPLSAVLSWTASRSATSYALEVSETADFIETVQNQGSLTDSSATITDLISNETYYWRVKASNSAGDSDWSEVWSFTTTSSPPNATLVAHWKMDESSGTTLLDASGNGNTAEIFGNPLRVASMDGQAVNFNGRDQFATAPDTNSLDFSNALTIAAWVKPEKRDTQYLVKKAVHNAIDGYEFSLSSSGKIFFRFNQDSSGNAYRIDSQSSYPSDGSTWIHVAVTYNGSVMKLYLDGIENASKNLASAPAININSLDIAIGAGIDGFRGIMGAMDDVRLYNVALSASEVNQLANFTSTPTVAEAPVLNAPADSSSEVALPPVLSWNASSGANHYSIQVSETDTFDIIKYNQEEISETIATISDLAENTTYFWRVKASNTAGESEWSTIWSFNTTSSPTPTTLVAHWKMDETSGATLLDDSGNGNNATTYGDPQRITGVNGQAVSFNGSDQYATATSSGSLDLSEALTIAAWIRPEKKDTQYLVKKAVHNSIDGYEFSLSSGGKVFFRFNQNSSGNTYRLDSQKSYPSDGNTWAHVAVTYDGFVMRLYIDGEESAIKTFSAPPPINLNSLHVALGAGTDGFRGIKGGMDDIRIYDNALSAAQIKDLASTMVTAEMSMDASAVNQENKIPVTVKEFNEEVKQEFFIYPNPFSSRASILFVFPENTEYSLTLFDMKGIKVADIEKGLAIAGERNIVELTSEGLGEGLYILRLSSQNGNSDIIKIMIGN